MLIGTVCKPSNLGGDKIVAVNIGCKPAWEICTDSQKSGLQLVNAWECPIGRAGCGLLLAKAGVRTVTNWPLRGADSNWSMLGPNSKIGQ